MTPRPLPTQSRLSPDQLRQSYLEYFHSAPRSHAVVPSSPLVPENDPTTLFTGSGMQPMMPYLLGEKHPKGTRIVDSQKCFRSQDIEEVGDNRHTTYFEMIGNWSLGDYFKAEQLEWFFSWLTDELGLEPQRLYVTVFGGAPEIGIPQDDEAVNIWKKLFSAKGIEADDIKNAATKGMQGGRIFYYPAAKNWWSRVGAPANMPIGEPGGPDSEVFYDFGEQLQLHERSQLRDDPCHVNCDCGRFLEIGNSVFMTYQRTVKGFEPLEQKNIDFGGGFERILAALANNPDVFQTAIFTPLITKLEKLSGKSYGELKPDHPDQAGEAEAKATTHAMRVVADHVRAAVMLAADGVYPSNKAQGYFARRLLRRAIRYAQHLGITQHFLVELVDVVAKLYATAYPEVAAAHATIKQVFAEEETKFRLTLTKGLNEFGKIVVNQKLGSQASLTAQTAFKLYESYGFPLELSMEEATKHSIAVEKNIGEIFQKLRAEHAAASRTASAGTFKGGLADQSENTLKYHTATHLLHAALREILGTHVEQKGSNITGERLRFDFSHHQAMSDSEKKQIEQLVNDWIKADLPVTKQIQTKADALASGAIAFFIEKYPDQVSLYAIGVDPLGSRSLTDLTTGWLSKELCGGPHVEHTGQIGALKLTKEQSVAAGVRRVYMELA